MLILLLVLGSLKIILDIYSNLFILFLEQKASNQLLNSSFLLTCSIKIY